MEDLRRTIMRRVYYAYAIRSITHPIFVHTLAFGLCFLALSQVISIPDIWANIMEVKVGELAGYLWHALVTTRTLTLLLLGVMAFITLSLLWRMVGRGRIIAVSAFGPRGQSGVMSLS